VVDVDVCGMCAWWMCICGKCMCFGDCVCVVSVCVWMFGECVCMMFGLWSWIVFDFEYLNILYTYKWFFTFWAYYTRVCNFIVDFPFYGVENFQD